MLVNMWVGKDGGTPRGEPGTGCNRQFVEGEAQMTTRLVKRQTL